MSAENLMSVYKKATPAELLEGLSAYPRYHQLMQRMAIELGYSLSTVCGVFSALSPNNDYLGNLRDARRLLEAHRAGQLVDDVRVHTYHLNKHKAWAIAGGTPPTEMITAHKTRNFYHNLLTPEDPRWVNNDGHMFWIWHGRKGNVVGSRKRNPVRAGGAAVTDRVYLAIASDCRALASALDILPCQFQAVCWHTWKRIHHKIHTHQLEFVPPDEVAAGLVNQRGQLCKPIFVSHE